ncbi:MAG: DUF4351 domain-containing protein [Magnetococcus sp. YQC-5]
MDKDGTKTCWHCLVGETLKSLLEPVGIEVRWEVPVIVSQPKADIILIQRKEGGRTEEQRLLLADGLRELDASHILAELKITESLTEKTLTWLSMHDTSYLETAKLERHPLRSVIISAITPRQEYLDRFVFEPVGPNGVYQSKPYWGGMIRLILLNELANEPHNAPLKCFASRLEERKKAFETIRQTGLNKLSVSFGQITTSLWRLLMKGSLNSPEMEGVTSDYLIQFGKAWFDSMVDATPDDELFSRPKFEHRLEQEHRDGCQEGEKKEATKILLRLLTRRFGDLSTSIREKLNAADMNTLELWTDRVLDAHSLEDVFGIPGNADNYVSTSLK